MPFEGSRRRVSLSAWFAHKVGWRDLDEDQLYGLFEFMEYMRTQGMDDHRPLSEWEEWYDAFFVEIEQEEEEAT